MAAGGRGSGLASGGLPRRAVSVLVPCALRHYGQGADERWRGWCSPPGGRVVAGGGRVTGHRHLPQLVVLQVTGRLEHRPADPDLGAAEGLRRRAIVLGDDVGVVGRADAAIQQRVEEPDRLLALAVRAALTRATSAAVCGVAAEVPPKNVQHPVVLPQLNCG